MWRRRGGGYTGCRGPLRVAGEVRATWFDVSVCECPMGARVIVVGVAGRGGLRWRRGTRVVVGRCERRPWDGQKIIKSKELDSALWIAVLERSL